MLQLETGNYDAICGAMLTFAQVLDPIIVSMSIKDYRTAIFRPFFKRVCRFYHGNCDEFREETGLPIMVATRDFPLFKDQLEQERLLNHYCIPILTTVSS